MTTTVKLLAPGAAPYYSAYVRGGVSYKADANGIISGVPVPSIDYTDLLGQGCTNLNTTSDIAGGSATAVNSSGHIGSVLSATGIGNAAALTDTVLGIMTIPASSFDKANREVFAECAGILAANNNDKQVKIWATTTAQTVGAAMATGGATVLVDSGVLATKNDLAWHMDVNFAKYGAAGSNTQMAYAGEVIIDTGSLGIDKPVLTSLAETSIIYIVVTGASPTTGAANDVKLNALTAQFSN